MAFTEQQEEIIKEVLPDILSQLATLQDLVVNVQKENAELRTKVAALEETVLSLDGWRTAIRLRVRQERNAI